MRKFILAPDSFKGSLSAIEICEVLEERIKAHLPEAEIISLPVADGGEGTVDCLLYAMEGEKITSASVNPYFEPMQASYGLVNEGKTAIIEMAACAGLPLVEDRKNPLETTTFGVGKQILDALNHGCREFVIGLGGSSTNDGGCGCAAALGVEFTDEQGESFVPAGGTLDRIAKIDYSTIDSRIKECRIKVMCDIDNPLYGTSGAAYIFGPQKGADDEMVKLLDANLRHLAGKIQSEMGVDVAEIPGAGAAGGMGAGMVAFLSGELVSGIDAVLDLTGYDELLDGTELVLTGEGRIDGQSLRGKVVVGVARRAAKKNVPVVAIVGDIGDDIEPVYDTGVTAVLSINRVAVPFSEARKRSRQDLKLTADTLMRLLEL